MLVRIIKIYFEVPGDGGVDDAVRPHHEPLEESIRVAKARLVTQAELARRDCSRIPYRAIIEDQDRCILARLTMRLDGTIFEEQLHA